MKHTYKFLMKKTSGAILLTTAVFSLLSGTIQMSEAAGYKTMKLDVAHREVPLPLHIWYPEGEGAQSGQPISLGENAVFKGTDVNAGAAVKTGKHPLVFLSHGSGGNAIGISWLAAYLADQGMIVVATNHPNTTSRNSIPKETVKLWERPQDISAMIDLFETSKMKPYNADMNKIAAVGFSLGGHTALAMGGARADKQDFIDYCSKSGGTLDCGWLKRGGVDLNSFDKIRYERNNIDDRVTSIVAIDPAISQAYKADSLKAMKVPVQLINLGLDDKAPLGINAEKISKIIPNAEYQQVNDATHFSFLAECTDKAEFILKAEGEEPICSETGTRTRASIHDELKTLIGNFLTNK